LLLLLIKRKETCTQYSGVDNEGKYVMGLLKYTTNNKRFEIDNILKWYTDTKWTLKDAAELPLAYLMVKNTILFYFIKL